MPNFIFPLSKDYCISTGKQNEIIVHYDATGGHVTLTRIEIDPDTLILLKNKELLTIELQHAAENNFENSRDTIDCGGEDTCGHSDWVQDNC